MKKILNFIRAFFATILSYTLGVVITLILSILAVLTLLVRFKYGIFLIERAWGCLLIWMLFRHPKIIGRENIQKGKTYVICANHSSIHDVLAISMIQPGMMAWVAKKALFSIPILGNSLSMGVAIPVDKKSIRKSAEALAEGLQKKSKRQSVGIFPEGTRTKDGKLQFFKRGFVKIARDTQMDILPITLNGFYSIQSDKKFYLNPKDKLEIIIHNPILYKNIVDKKDKEVVDELRMVIEKDYYIK